jgi:hypothetical protein
MARKMATVEQPPGPGEEAMTPTRKAAPKARKKKKKRTVPARKPRVPPPPGKVSEEFRELAAETNLSPSLSAAVLIKGTRDVRTMSPDGESVHIPSLEEVRSALLGKIQNVQDGDMKGMEAMLVFQAHALDDLFQDLAGRALRKEGLRQFEGMMKLALRTQSQCRTTIETLSVVKNPRQAVAFVKQANIAEMQQVNNNHAQAVAPAGEKEDTPNKVIEVPHGKELLDAGTTPVYARDDSPLEAVGAIHRPAHDGR